MKNATEKSNGFCSHFTFKVSMRRCPLPTYINTFTEDHKASETIVADFVTRTNSIHLNT